MAVDLAKTIAAESKTRKRYDAPVIPPSPAQRKKVLTPQLLDELESELSLKLVGGRISTRAERILQVYAVEFLEAGRVVMRARIQSVEEIKGAMKKPAVRVLDESQAR